MKLDTQNKMKELFEEACANAEKARDKGVAARARAARKNLSEISKLCKLAREELLEIMKKD
jgi:hypothetical protein